MSHDSVSRQEPKQPEPKQEHLLALLQESSRELQAKARRPGRPASISWTHLCLGIVLCFLRGWDAQLDLWRLLCWESVGSFAPVRVSDQAIYNRLARAEKYLRQLFEQVSTWLLARLEGRQDRNLAPWANEVYAVDESTLDKVGRWLPWLRELADGEKDLLAGRMSAIFDVRRQLWKRVELLEDGKANCKEYLLQLLSGIQAGALVLLDRGYFSFAIFDELSARGLFWISRYANKASFQIAHISYQGDGILDAVVYLGIYRSDQAKYAVRLIRFWWRGKQYSYLTNVLDPTRLSVADVVRLYARRWDIELAFRALKDHLNQHHLWSAKWPVIQVQLWCGLLLAQMYHGLQVEIAGQAGVEVFDVSMDLLVRFTPRWLQAGLRPIEQAVRFGREQGLIRPSTRNRIEVPWIDPVWVVPPPADAVQPRSQVRHRPPKAKGLG